MIADVLSDADSRMAKAIEALQHHLATVRTGRASPSLVDRIVVEYYGSPTPLNQMANISVPESRLLVIQPYDKGVIGAIEKAIQKSDLGLNPNNDGQVIRIGIPALTEERRKQLVKLVHQYVEEGKVAIRNVRRDAQGDVKSLLGEKMISEDDETRGHKQIDELTKKYTDEMDRIGKSKEHEVLEV
jgi:ribosome recycling factor